MTNSRLQNGNIHLQMEIGQLQLENGRLQSQNDYFRRSLVIFKWPLDDFILKMIISNCNGKLQMAIVLL